MKGEFVLKTFGSFYYDDRTVESLNMISGGGVYEFVGSKGLGKRHAADEMARVVLKTKKLETHPDFCLVSPDDVKGAYGIEVVEKIKDFSATLPVYGAVKVIVIDDADTLTDAAQNALLKLLEEKTDYMLFLLIAHQSMIPTVESRSVRIWFYALSMDMMREVAGHDGRQVDELALRLAGGKPGAYDAYVSENGYLEAIRGSLSSLEKGNKRGVFEALHMIREKDRDMFFDRHELSFVQAYAQYLRDIFFWVLLYVSGISTEECPGCDIKELSKNYSILMIQASVSYLGGAVRRMRTGKFNKNDWFDMIRFLVE